MEKIQQEDIHLVARYSNLSKNSAESVLQKYIYNTKADWQKFIQLFILSLGVGFMVSGIVLFFAYNWNDLNKFLKFGLVEGLTVTLSLVILFSNLKLITKNILLTAASALVGILFAIFGQVYQTGADAYDFFLAWTIFITLWVVVSNFAPLWLIFLVLINITIGTYAQQVAKDWSEIFVMTIFFVLNMLTLFITILITHKNKVSNIPNWFIHTIALAVASFATIGIINGIFENKYKPSFLILIALSFFTYIVGIWYGFKTKKIFYFSVIPFSIIIVLSALLAKISDKEPMILFIGVFIVAGVTLTIKNILNLQKKWLDAQ
jgi:uncharacterized membrane protein